jgi:signal transduction histidine kinase
MTYQLLTIVGAEDSQLYGIVIWVFVAARAAVWYGFLFALVAAQLFAARATERLLEQSLNHPSKGELEIMLREPLGDPQLRLQFLQDDAAEPDLERRAVEAGPGRDVTVVQRAGSPPAAIEHDAQLNDDPELLNSAGAVALLAAENAELDAGWHEAVRDLERSRMHLEHSRSRLVRAADEERRKVERNLHDGVQHRLIAIMIRLGMGAEDATIDSATRDRLSQLIDDVEGTLEEVRAVSHGLYPPVLLELGLVAALQSVKRRTPVPLSLHGDGVGRYSPDVEAAVYYACVEAIQNATKHGGPHPRITVTLFQDGDQVRFKVEDDGVGFEPERIKGAGLQNMQDRLGALGGSLTVRTAPGQGAVITGSVPSSPRPAP